MTDEDLELAQQLIDAYTEYVAFLAEAYQGPAGMAYVHGWRCPTETFDEGEKHRQRIYDLREKLAA